MCIKHKGYINCVWSGSLFWAFPFFIFCLNQGNLRWILPAAPFAISHNRQHTHKHKEPANRFLHETLMEDLAAGQRWPALHVACFMLLGRREYLILFVAASFMTIWHLRPLYSTGALVVSCIVKKEGSEAQMFHREAAWEWAHWHDILHLKKAQRKLKRSLKYLESSADLVSHPFAHEDTS